MDGPKPQKWTVLVESGPIFVKRPPLSEGPSTFRSKAVHFRRTVFLRDRLLPMDSYLRRLNSRHYVDHFQIVRSILGSKFDKTEIKRELTSHKIFISCHSRFPSRSVFITQTSTWCLSKLLFLFTSGPFPATLKSDIHVGE